MILSIKEVTDAFKDTPKLSVGYSLKDAEDFLQPLKSHLQELHNSPNVEAGMADYLSKRSKHLPDGKVPNYRTYATDKTLETNGEKTFAFQQASHKTGTVIRREQNMLKSH